MSRINTQKVFGDGKKLATTGPDGQPMAIGTIVDYLGRRYSYSGIEGQEWHDLGPAPNVESETLASIECLLRTQNSLLRRLVRGMELQIDEEICDPADEQTAALENVP